MDLYTLNENFLAKDTIDEFVSAIWTERYSAAGDVRMVVAPTQENIDRLAPGTFLALRGTKEVMQLATQEIEKGLLTVIGSSLILILNERYAWFKNPATSSAADRIVDYTDATKKPGAFISDVVDKMVIHPVTLGGAYAPADLLWALETIPHLSLGAVSAKGTVKRLTIPIGPLYDGIADIAQKEGFGISLYLDSADPVLGYSLKFKTYFGEDQTLGGQVGIPEEPIDIVRLVPDMDQISDLKEIHSISNWKNVAYVYYQGIITTHLAEPFLPAPEGFNRRVLITDTVGEPVGRKITNPFIRPYNASGGQPPPGGAYTGYTVGAAEIAAFREQNARDALANHNYIRAIDGQAAPHSDYKFGVDYGLGDIIELQGLTGEISNARVTEYIRSEDKTGEKEYPTISVIS